jgi:regulator of sigma E protease
MNIFDFLHQGLSAIVPFVILLGILIFVHELGHYLVAVWCGVRVEVFSLGFGKKILQYKKGDTTYAISLIPLGGYVKMFGEQLGSDISEEDKKFSFTHKTVWQRIAIVLAGPLMNFFFAIFIFFLVALRGEQIKSPVIGDVANSTAAYSAGFRSGDTIISINGKSIRSWEDVTLSLSQKESQDVQLNVVVQREAGSQETLNTFAKAEPNPNILSRYTYMANIEGLTPYAAGTAVGVVEGSPLQAIGLKTGDVITEVNGTKVTFWRQLEKVITEANPREKLTLNISGKRDNDSTDKNFALTLAPIDSISQFSFSNLGIENSELYIYKILENSPAQAAGLQAFDRISEINGVRVDRWDDVIKNIKSFDGKNPVSISVIRAGRLENLKITPKLTTQMTPGGAEDKRYTIGISPIPNIAMPDFVLIKSDWVGSAIVRGVEKTWDISIMTVLSFVRLFQAKISPKHIGGVISIGQAASETFKIGLTQFLQMMAIISVNLFILNLLPVPVLDGGHLMFYVIEVIKGAPLSMRKMEIAQQVGLALLMSLMVFALFNDFTRLLGL